jgi:hypothetical protein
MVGAVDLFADGDTARTCVSALKQKPTEDSNLHRRLSVCLIAGGEKVANSRWTSDSYKMAALKPTWLCRFSITMTDYVMSCHTIPVTLMLHTTCGHCTFCVCHVILSAMRTQSLQALCCCCCCCCWWWWWWWCCCCFLIISLSVTADDCRTFRRHQYIHIPDILQVSHYLTFSIAKITAYRREEWNESDRVKPQYQSKACPKAALPTTNAVWVLGRIWINTDSHSFVWSKVFI